MNIKRQVFEVFPFLDLIRREPSKDFETNRSFVFDYSPVVFCKEFDEASSKFSSPSDLIVSYIEHRIKFYEIIKDRPFAEYYNSKDFKEPRSIYDHINIVMANEANFAVPLTERYSINSRYNDKYRIENEMLFTILQVLQLILEQRDETNVKENIFGIINSWDAFESFLNDKDNLVSILKINPNLLRTKYFCNLNLCTIQLSEAEKIFSQDNVKTNDVSAMLKAVIILLCFDSNLKKIPYKDLHDYFEKSGIQLPIETFNKRIGTIYSRLGIN